MTTIEHNPQAAQMSDESMVRNLAAQAEAIWVQERPLFDRYKLANDCRILDVGCGTGEISSRLAEMYSQATVIGVDLLESSLNIARDRHGDLAPRLEFRKQDAFDLEFAAHGFDLVVCRHMLQAVPRPITVMAGLKRQLKPGGWLHMINEDYGMLHMQQGDMNPDRLWHDGAIALLQNTGTDGRIGRNSYTMLHRLGMTNIRIDYVVLDTLRVERETFARIMQAWRDGFSNTIAKNTILDEQEINDTFAQVLADIRNPERYAVWHVPVVSARNPR